MPPNDTFRMWQGKTSLQYQRLAGRRGGLAPYHPVYWHRPPEGRGLACCEHPGPFPPGLLADCHRRSVGVLYCVRGQSRLFSGSRGW